MTRRQPRRAAQPWGAGGLLAMSFNLCRATGQTWCTALPSDSIHGQHRIRCPNAPGTLDQAPSTTGIPTHTISGRRPLLTQYGAACWTRIRDRSWLVHELSPPVPQQRPRVVRRRFHPCRRDHPLAASCIFGSIIEAALVRTRSCERIHALRDRPVSQKALIPL